MLSGGGAPDAASSPRRGPAGAAHRRIDAQGRRLELREAPHTIHIICGNVSTRGWEAAPETCPGPAGRPARCRSRGPVRGMGPGSGGLRQLPAAPGPRAVVRPPAQQAGRADVHQNDIDRPSLRDASEEPRDCKDLSETHGVLAFQCHSDGHPLRIPRPLAAAGTRTRHRRDPGPLTRPLAAAGRRFAQVGASIATARTPAPCARGPMTGTARPVIPAELRALRAGPEHGSPSGPQPGPADSAWKRFL